MELTFSYTQNSRWTIRMLFAHAECPVRFIPLSSILYRHHVY